MVDIIKRIPFIKRIANEIIESRHSQNMSGWPCDRESYEWLVINDVLVTFLLSFILNMSGWPFNLLSANSNIALLATFLLLVFQASFCISLAKTLWYPLS